MAIFDTNKVVNLTFYLVLNDPAEVARLNALYPEGVNRAPYNAAGPSGASIEFGAPWKGLAASAAAFEAPFSYTDWPSSDDKPFPTNVATFQRHTGGVFGIGGTTVRYYWIGQFVYATPKTPGSGPGGGPTTVNAVTKRRWIEGFESIGRPAATTLSLLALSTDASRHVGGRGLAIRGQTNWYFRQLLNEADASFTNQTKSWERFYLRVRRLPAVAATFWRADMNTNAGPALGITPGGQLALYSHINQGSPYTFVTALSSTFAVGTGHADDDAWHRIDLLIDLAGAGSLKVRVDGAEVYSGPGWGSSLTGHTGSYFVIPSGVTGDLHLDIDDWMNANQPTTFDGQDWLNGSKVVLIKPTAYSANHGTWTGDVRVLNQNHQPAASGAFNEVTSTTSGAVLAADTDADVSTADPASVGIAALIVHASALKGAGALNGSIGYKLGAAAPVVKALSQDSAVYTHQAIIGTNETGASAPLATITPIELRLVHGADTGNTRVAVLNAQAELLGKWGACDHTPAERDDLGDAVQANDSTGPHNHPYPTTPWAHRGLAPPISPYVLVGGTYVGTGTGLDLTFRAPVHWFYTRPVGGTSAGGFLWASPMGGSHKNFARAIEPDITHAEADPSFVGAAGEDAQQQRFRLRLAGNDAQLNAVGVTYQYIAICDPGMRFLINGSYLQKSTLVPGTVTLINPDFVPEFAFFLPEVVPGGSSTRSLYAKGPGQAAATIVGYGANAVANAATFGPGSFTSESGLNGIQNDAHFTYSVFRRDDGSEDTGLPGVVAFGSYVGDGAASRTVPIVPASGKRPFFAMVFAESGSLGYHRDPSHTTTNSSRESGTDNTTGITAGSIDGFTVGSSLNTNGVTFVWFALPGSATAGNNGWSINGEFIPVEANTPGDGPWPDDPGVPDEEEDDDVGEEPEVPGFQPPGTTPDFAATCWEWSTYMLNLALARIGQGKQITDIRTDTSEEAYKGRLIYGMDVDRTLRDFPWPFATRYADLVLVGGTASTPVNKDWQYSYRAPASLVYARRLVGQAGEARAWATNPVQFRLGSDATGYLIYTNVPIGTNTPVHLEYTVRVSCAAQVGDALFRDALAWKLAASLATVLARDDKKAQQCELMYRDVLRAAKAVAANESQPDPTMGDAPWITGRG